MIKGIVMRRAILYIITFVFCAGAVHARDVLRIRVLDVESGDPIVGANVFFKGTTIGAVTDCTGTVFLQPLSQNVVLVSAFIGY